MGIEPLHTQRDTFVTASGNYYNWQGNIDFMAFKRSLDGVDMGFITQRQQAGSQSLTTLMMAHYIEDFIPSTYGARFFAHIKPFAQFLRSLNLYWRPIVFADAQVVMPDKGQQQTFLAQCAAEFNGEWNVLPSLCNEYQKNGCDPFMFQRPATDNLWSRGSSTSDTEPARPGWDYKEWHSRRDWPKVLFGNDDAWYVKEGIDSNFSVLDRAMPCIIGEPIGFWDHDVPARRSQDPNLAAVVGGTSVYFARGADFMSEGGLRCDRWDPRTEECARRFYAAINQ
jgi:hypothetical protein